MADEPSSSTTPKPKVFRTRAGIVRKTKAEREEYVKQEAERAAARAAAAANASERDSLGSQPKQKERRTRDNKQKDGQNTQSRGSGVFGAGVGSRPSSTRKKQDGGRSEMLEGQEGALPEEANEKDVSKDKQAGKSGSAVATTSGNGKRAAGAGSHATVDEPPYDVEQEADDEPERDIEQIWISSDEEDIDEDDEDVVTSKGKATATTIRPSRLGTGLRPVRAARTYPDEQTTDNASTKNPQRQFKSSRVVQDDHDMFDDDGAEMDIDEDQIPFEHSNVKQDILGSPELSRKKSTKRSATKGKDPRAAIETAEERAERARLNEDIRKMKEEFITLPKLSKEEQQGAQTYSDDVDGSKRKLLLFQFPPLVPYLVDSESIAAPKSPVMAIKNDPDAPTDSLETGDGASTNLQPSAKKHTEGFLTAIEPTRLPPGRVGKLQVHKSGKVTLDWGGTNMELRHGTEVDFLQDAVLVEPSQEPPADDGSVQGKRAQAGTTYALGQVTTKFVAIPDWQKLYD